MNKRGFTLIELLIIVAIIGILASAILISVNQARKNARINGAKTSMKTVLSAIIACKDGGGAVMPRTAGNAICSLGMTEAKWPALPNGYAYAGGAYDSVACNFTINTANDTTKLGNTFVTCSCIGQTCE